MRSRKVLKCCCASTVVGTSTATCLPSITALNAARMATSVLPKPDVAADQPVHRLGPFHVGLGLDDGAHLVGGFLEDEGALELALPGRCPAAKGWPACDSRAAWMASSSLATSRTARSACALALAQRVPPSVLSGGPRLAGADVFADQVRLGDRHVELGRRLGGVAAGRIR